MKTISNLIAALTVGGTTLGATAVGHILLDGKAMKVKRTPVLVELFTSEGCNSCPSADALLKKLQREQPVENALVIPLGEHVDYWDGNSWRDRFSTAENTQRQVFYAHHFHIDGPYTPQMVVDGQTELLGSDEAKAKNAIESSASHRRAQINLTTSRGADSSFNVSIEVSGLDKSRADGFNAVFLAVVEDNLTTHVKGGENGGRTLDHTAVMRRLVRVADIPANTSWSRATTLKLDPSWKSKDLQLVAFVQGTKSGHIFGSSLAEFDNH